MKVLIVDDDVVSRMVLMHLIDSSGAHEIVEADDGAEAWNLIEAGLRPAICFCDLRMPRVSGMELLARFKAHADVAATPFVLVSSASDRDTVGQANSLGADGYIVKPFEAAQVRAHLAALAPGSPSARALAEAPDATMKRLGINSERLAVYLGGFHNQLAGASAEIAALIAQSRLDAARVRLERLHAGSLTLGLHGASAALAGVLATPGPGLLDAAAVQEAVAEAMGAVLQQSEALKHIDVAM